MLEVKTLKELYIPQMVAAFTQIGWHKPSSLFLQYFQEQIQQERFVYVAFEQEAFIGYVTLKKYSLYPPFQMQHIPEISDLNVLPYHRKKGVGTLLLEVAETKAREFASTVGIGFGMSHDYGQAQRLYIKRHYLPDGHGLTYQYQNVIPGHPYPVDDDLVLWLTKTFDNKKD